MSDQNSPVTAQQVGGSPNVYAPPTAHVDDVVPEGEMVLAERGTRLAAAIIDGLVPGVIGIVAAIAIPAAARSTAATYVMGGLIVITAIALIALNCLWIHQRGQTVGKRVMSIKTVRKDGSRCGLGRVFLLRYLPTAILSAIPIIGFVIGITDCLLIFRDSRQCLHDNIADTLVIKV
jgi:uncharacterized RDD family membrane protein YckC